MLGLGLSDALHGASAMARYNRKGTIVGSYSISLIAAGKVLTQVIERLHKDVFVVGRVHRVGVLGLVGQPKLYPVPSRGQGSTINL